MRMGGAASPRFGMVVVGKDAVVVVVDFWAMTTDGTGTQ